MGDKKKKLRKKDNKKAKHFETLWPRVVHNCKSPDSWGTHASLKNKK